MTQLEASGGQELEEPQWRAWSEVAGAVVDGLLTAVVVTVCVGDGGRRFVQALVPGPAWLPVEVWLGASLWALLAALLALTRLSSRAGDPALTAAGGRAPAPPAHGLEWVGRSAMLLLMAVTLAPTLACALGLTAPVWAVCLFAPLSVCGAAWAMGGAAPGRRWRRAALVSACQLQLVLLLGTCWPLRLTVWLAQAPLTALAERVAAGQAPTGPEWAGPFRIARTELRSGTVFLITVPDPAGYGGLARHEWSSSNAPFPFNVSTVDPVGEGWVLVFED